MGEIEQIYRKYQPVVYRYLYDICGDSLLAEEITQETFFQIISLCCSSSGLKSEWFFRKRESAEARLCRFADRLLKGELSRQEMERAGEPSDLGIMEIPSLDYLPEVYAVWRAETDEISEKILELEEPLQSVISLRYYQNMTYKEVGVCLHHSENWVKYMLQRAKSRLKRMMG